MNRQPEQQGPRSGRSVFGKMILKGLFLYALVPALLLIFLAQPVSAAVRGSGSAAFPLLLAALGVVCLNWFVYAAFHRRCPSLLVFAHGVFCLFAFLIVEYAALPPTDLLTSSLADIGGCLVFAHLFLFSFWLASCRSKFAHSAAVVIWVIIGIIAVFMVYRIWRDFEARTVTQDTWINIAILVILCPVPFAYRIRASVRGQRHAAGHPYQLPAVSCKSSVKRAWTGMTNLSRIIMPAFSTASAIFPTRRVHPSQNQP